MNCCGASTGTLGIAGVMSMDWRTAEVTVRVVLPETAPDVAVIVTDPAARDVARPLEPAALLIAAIAVFDEFQVTDAVRSWVELSE